MACITIKWYFSGALNSFGRIPLLKTTRIGLNGFYKWITKDIFHWLNCLTAAALLPIFHDLCPLTSTWSHIWDVMLVWRKGNIEKNCLCITVLCTIIMVHKGMNSSYGSVDCIGLWSCLVYLPIIRAPLYVQFSWCYIYNEHFLVTFFPLPFSELSLVGLALDLVD